jgi:hypothetical protein
VPAALRWAAESGFFGNKDLVRRLAPL